MTEHTHSLQATINIEVEHEYIITLYASKNGLDGYDVQEELREKIHALAFVEETCFNHCSWVKLDLETDDFMKAEIRLQEFKNKLSDLFASYV